jgi:CP family cyanate transporter-like MFS transporter
MTSPRESAAGRALPWLLIAGVLVAAMSLRGPIVAPTPVLRDIEHDLGLGATTVALLTTAPVLMFAILTPVAAYVIRRSGPELALLISLTGVLLGTFIRGIPDFAWMLVGTVVIGAAITVGNVVIPVIIRRDVPPGRVSLVTAAYVAMLNAGSLLTSLLTAPLASLVGWPVALLLWSVLTIAGTVLWGTHLARWRRAGIDPGGRYSGESVARPGRAGEIDPRTLTGPMPVISARGGSLLRRPVPWLLLATFACQTFIYFGFTTWLPVLSGDLLALDRTAAGALASIFQGVGVVGAFVVPLLTRVAPPWVTVVVISGSWLALTIGVLTAPSLMMLWLSIGAIGHSGGFVAVFSVLVQVARSDAEAAGMSALVQGGGYAIGALAGPVLGALHEVSGDWTGALIVLVVVSAVYTVLLSAAFAAVRRAAR